MYKSKRKITHIVYHTSASYNSRLGVIYPTAKDIDAMHKARGWSGIGYHFVIGEGGTIEQGRDIDAPGAHVAGFNTTTIGVCVSGHGDYKDWTPKQKETAIKVGANLIRQNGLEAEFRKNPMRVLGHAEVGTYRQGIAAIVRMVMNWSPTFSIPHPHKSCPGKLVSMRELRLGILRELNNG